MKAPLNKRKAAELNGFPITQLPHMPGESSQGLPPQILLVIGDLDDNWHLEDLLQPDIEHEGDEVAQVERF